MLEHLGNFKFIGDLSLEDADILAYHGKRSSNILEYGVGGSTQIFAQCMPQIFVAVDTNIEWIDKTKSRLEKIKMRNDPKFYSYDDYMSAGFKTEYDLIFVDGLWQHRKAFAQYAWKSLSHYGVMIFHDTRRDFDFRIAMESVQDYYLEVSKVEVNAKASNNKSSNLTIIYKKYIEPYVNWNHTENKPMWAYGDLNYDGELWQQENIK